MSTFIQDFIENLEPKWREVDILINTAIEIRDTNEALYNALCRSITILIVSHMEGFTKDLTKKFIADLNKYCEFKELETAIQRTYCENYISKGNDKAHDNKVNKLINKFSEYNCDISYEGFLFDKNKNPTSNIIKIIFENFGINNIFTWIEKSTILNSVFENNLLDIKEIKDKIRGELITNTNTFPYNVQELISNYELKKPKNGKYNKTLWDEFISETNQNRHNIVHGNNFTNTDDIHSLELRKEKTILFQYILILLLINIYSS